MKTFELTLVLTTIALQTCLALLLARRNLHKLFRAFFTYTLIAVAIQSAGLFFLRHPRFYFTFYWITEALFVLFAFLGLYEVFRWVFRNFYGIVWFRFAFPTMGMLMLIVATVRSLLLPAPDVLRVVRAIISLEIAVGFLQVGILVLFFLLVRFFHMSWRQYAFGIALGFGIIACGNLAIFLLRSEFGTKFNPVVEITPPIAYIIAVVVWLAAFLPPQPDHPLKDWVPPLTPEEMVTELRQYTSAVKGVLRR